MSGNSNNGRVREPERPECVRRLLTLIEQLEENRALLERALAKNDMNLVSQYDQATIRAFDKILDLNVEETQARVLLVEFLLEQLQIDQTTLNDRIRSKILKTVQIE